MASSASHLVSAAQWVAGVIAEKAISSKLKEWASRFSNLGDDADRLKAQMSYVKTVLSSAQGMTIQNAELTTLLARLHQLEYEADDALHELDNLRLQQEAVGRQDQAGEAAASFSFHLLSHQPLASPVVRDIVMHPWGRRKRRKLADRTVHDDDFAAVPAQTRVEHERRALCRRIREVADQLRDVGEQVSMALQQESISLQAAVGHGARPLNPRLTTSYPAGDLKMFGRNDQMDSIIEMLTERHVRSPLLVLPVVGNGGIGKTTLLQHVYHDRRVRSFFHIRMWVCVPRNYDVVQLTHEILDAATGEKQHRGSSENLNNLQDKLEKRLQCRRFLLVLDDLWTVDDKRWDLLLAPLRWIGQTREKSAILVTTRDRRVANLTGTMPLIDLCGLKEKAFYDCFRAHIFGDENHKGHQHLQPIGRQIAKKLNGYPLAAKSVGAILRNDLSTQHWNKILKSRVWDPHNATDGIMSILRLSYEYLSLRLRRCFLYCSLFPKGYRFHERDLVLIWDSQGLVDARYDMTPEEVGREYLNDLLSLGFFQRVVSAAAYHPSWYIMHDIIHDLALDVSSNYCLTIDHISMLKMQPSGTIRHLTIITDSVYHEDIDGNIERNEAFEKAVIMIASLLQLKQLRSLMLFGKYDSNFAHVFRRAFREATNLRSIILSMIPYHEGSLFYDLGQSNHLRYIRIIADDHVPFPESLCKLHHLQVLDVGGSIGDLPRNVNDGYNRAETPIWLAKHIVLTSLHSLYLSNCKGCKVFQALLQFPAVKKLHLISVVAIAELHTASLEELILSDMPELHTCTITEEHKLIDDLQLIKITDCPKLRDFPLPLEGNSVSVDYHQLRSLVIKNCSSLMPLPPLPLGPQVNTMIHNVQSFPCQQMSYTADANPSLLLKNMNQLTVLDGTVISFRKLPSLQELSIDTCPNLSKFSWEGFQQFSILKDMTIYHCPKLLSMPMTQTEKEHAKGLLPSLERLEIWSCCISGKNLSCLLSNLPNLSLLKLKDCRKITRLVIDKQSDEDCSVLLPDNAEVDGLLHIRTHSLPSLQELCFDSCPTECENGEGLRGLVTLEKLEISQCPGFLSYLVSEDEDMHHVEDTCLIPSSLHELKIDNAEWKFMSLHGLTAMKKLSILYSGLEVLDLESCTQLEHVHISCCQALSHLHGLHSCIQLRRLEVVLLTPHFWRACDIALQSEGAGNNFTFPVEHIHTNDSSILTMSLCKHLNRLRRLEFQCLNNELRVEQEKALEQLISLNELQFLDCDGDFSIPTKLQQLTSLKKLEIMKCHTISTFLERSLPPALEHLVISHCDYLTSLPVGMHGLKKLEIKSCSRIQALPNGSLPSSLQELTIEKCSPELQEQLQKMNKANMVIYLS